MPFNPRNQYRHPSLAALRRFVSEITLDHLALSESGGGGRAGLTGSMDASQPSGTVRPFHDT